MAGKSTEIVGTWEREKYRFANTNGDVVIGEVDSNESLTTISVKGPESEPFRRGSTYRFYGEWTTYNNKRTGKSQSQFSFSSYVECEPLTESAVVGYLTQFDGIGPGTARDIWKKYGQQSVSMLREHPLTVAEEVKRLREGVAIEASELLKDRKGIEATLIEVLDLLRGRYFPKRIAMDCIRLWGAAAASIIRRDPYKLLRFKGTGFSRCDAMYLALGNNPRRLKRQAFAAWHHCKSDKTGSTWILASDAYNAVIAKVGAVDVNPARAVKLALRYGLLKARWSDEEGNEDEDGSVMWVADAVRESDESGVAFVVCQMLGANS